jgi:hypothetical protein
MRRTQWADEHRKCREKYLDILQIENPGTLFQLDRPGNGKGCHRFDDKCKKHNAPKHNAPMYVWSKARGVTIWQPKA